MRDRLILLLIQAIGVQLLTLDWLRAKWCSQPMHRYREARERSGVTECQAAQGLQISPKELRAIEACEQPSEMWTIRLAAYYEVSECWISGHNGQVLGSRELQNSDARMFRQCSMCFRKGAPC